LITSAANEQIKSIRKLRDKRHRTESGLAYVEGSKLVIDAILQKARIEKIIISQSYAESEKRAEIQTFLTTYAIEQTLVSDEVFASISQKDNPQGIGAVVRQDWLKLDELSGIFSGLWVGLLEIADPGNLGTIMRTIDATGARGIFLIGNCTDPYDPSAIRASMGALFRNTIIKTEVDSFTNWARGNNIALVGTSDSAETNYRNIVYPRDMILMMGSERQGLTDAIEDLCIDMVCIPMTGISDSLNLAVATGIILYEILHQTTESTG